MQKPNVNHHSQAMRLVYQAMLSAIIFGLIDDTTAVIKYSTAETVCNLNIPIKAKDLCKHSEDEIEKEVCSVTLIFHDLKDGRGSLL